MAGWHASVVKYVILRCGGGWGVRAVFGERFGGLFCQRCSAGVDCYDCWPVGVQHVGVVQRCDGVVVVELVWLVGA